MKISIGTNIFGNDLKQNLGIQTQVKLKNLYPDNVFLYAFQRYEEETVPYSHTKKLVNRDSRDFVEAGKKTSLCVKDIFDGLAETDCDYIVYTNSDILFSENFIKYLLNGNYIGYACSRMDIHPIQSLNDKIIPYRYEVAGQDVFVIKKDWYIKNRHLFKEYLIGSIWYDTALTCILKQYGQNDPIINQEITEPWGWYYHNILIKRPSGFDMFELYPNEKQIEKEHFGKYMMS